MNSSTRTPLKLTNKILQLCSGLRSDSEPLFVSVTPSKYAVKNECFDNVEKHIQIYGGTVEFGWQIWEWPLVLVEAEFHAIWKSKEGKRVDITPKPFPTKQILFLPDPTRKYTGKQVRNVRLPLKDTAPINEYINLCDKEFALLNRGSRARQREITLSNSERQTHRSIMIRKQILSEQFSKFTPARNEPCFCGSGEKYKRCCR